MNTIRGRILIGYLALTLSILLIVAMCLWTLKRYGDITTVQSKVYELQVQALELKNATQQIIFSDAISTTAFHEKPTTERLDFTVRTFDDARRSLGVIRDNDINAFGEFSYDIDSMIKLLAVYERQFNQSIDLFKQRGFKDWGAEGAMREQIHQLEKEAQDIPLTGILQLRRHEKDYFMRNDLAYASELHALINQLLTSLPKDHKEHQLLRRYEQLFSRIVDLEQQIGDETQGLVAGILQSQDHLTEATATLQFNIDTTADRLIKNLYMILTMAVLLCILAAAISSAVLPPLIVRPLQRLSASMQRIIDSHFEETLAPHAHDGIKEIDRLSDSYNSLLKEIRTQLDTVQVQNDELLQLNDKLTESEQKARQLSSLKDKFFSIISHDLRGPMSTALLFLSTLQDNPESIPPDKLKELFKKLNENFINLNRLMVNLLTWAKSQMNAIKLAIQENDPAEVARQNLELFKESVSKKELKASVHEEETSRCLADPNMLDFIIRNIISNAIKFTEQGGRITVTVRAVDDECQITIEDTGVGMTQEQIGQIYSAEEYMTTKGTANEVGTGLGLLLCNEFVEQNNGKLSIQSEEGQGSTFTITLPLAEKTTTNQTLMTEGEV